MAADIITPSTAHMSPEERRAGVEQMCEDLALLATQDGCIAAGWALEVVALAERTLADLERVHKAIGPTSADGLHVVVTAMCKPCLDGDGGECHTPGCFFWMQAGPHGDMRHRCSHVDGIPTEAP